MKFLLTFLIAALLLSVSSVISASSSPYIKQQHLQHLQQQRKAGGVNFLNGQWSSAYKYSSGGAAQSLTDAITGAAVDSIAITFCEFIPSINATGPITPHSTTPTTEELSKIVSAYLEKIGAGKANLTNAGGGGGGGRRTIMWRPCIDPNWDDRRNAGTWRGEIGLYYTSDTQWKELFTNYRDYIKKWAAAVASIYDAHAAAMQQRGVEMIFSIGMEYLAMTNNRHRNSWAAVAQTVKAQLGSGRAIPTIYCANHGNAHAIDWWPLVDVIGVDAYYPLAVFSSAPSVDELVASWHPIVAGLGQLSQQYQKPIYFSEIGYQSLNQANLEPAAAPSKIYNETVQMNLYEAFFRAVWPQPWFAGCFWWAWLSDPADAGNAGSSFTVHGKPTEKLVRHYYSKL